MGYTVFYLSIIVIIPLIALFTEAFSLGWNEFVNASTRARVIASYRATCKFRNHKQLISHRSNFRD
jgi:sulfate transport system permease protein